ncbi:MAG TPA: M2 family metallopeptidase [Pirellulales bacterium]|nr:M2 family metallopeptidase [Pirellulales bacterium]
MPSVSLRLGVTLMFALAMSASLNSGQAAEIEATAKQLVAEYERDFRPLEIETGRRWWDANVSGSDEAYRLKQEAENQLDQALADRDRFARLKRCDAAKLADPLLARQIRILYLQAVPKQVDHELLRQMVARANGIEKQFNVFRANVGGEELADSAVKKVLKQSRDSDERRAVWEASKRVGQVVEQDLRTLVAMRNQAARQLGFADYHAMQLELNEQNQAQVLSLFDQLDELTREPFRAAKREIDAKLAENCGIPVDELRPWHYHDPFFQESPAVFETSLDAEYAKVDVIELCEKFYAGIGLPIDDVLQRSDLFEKPGKNPHAFCTDIDREGDVRVLANVVPDEQWMSTMLHELGHAAYSSKNIPRALPYAVRCEAHILATEGVAMMFERFSKSADWLREMGVDVSDPKAFNAAGAKMRRNRLLIFSRWCQVMLRFEKELYRDPDQNLNDVWWDLVEKYQLLQRPEDRGAPDYGSKIHIVIAPAYYHNYMLGELFACQVHATIARDVLKTEGRTASYVGRKDVGKFMRERVFAPGRTKTWNELTKFATGEELNARAFAADFAEEKK